MEKSDKNKLQEYFQKRRLPLPKYTDRRVREQEWKTTLYLHGGQTFKSTIHRSKLEAQLEVATKALERLGISESNHHSRVESSKEQYSKGTLSNSLENDSFKVPSMSSSQRCLKLRTRTVLYIDTENQQKAVDNLLSYFTFVNLRIFAIKSRSSHCVNIVSTSDILDVITVDSHAKDASDIFITMLSSLHASNSNFDEYLILTTDNFGFTLSDLLKGESGLWKVKSTCFSSLEELKLYLISASE